MTNIEMLNIRMLLLTRQRERKREDTFNALAMDVTLVIELELICGDVID